MPRSMPVQRLDQCRGLFRAARDLVGPRQRHLARAHGRGTTVPGEFERSQQLARRFHLRQRVVRKPNTEAALDAGQKLDPRQAVETEIALELAVQPGTQLCPRLKLADDRIDQAQQRMAIVLRVRLQRFFHAWLPAGRPGSRRETGRH